MKYELGDKVRIKKYWKHKNLYVQLGELGIENLEEHLRTDEMAGTSIKFDKYRKQTVNEKGIVIGIREYKKSYSLWHEFQDSYDTGMGMMPEIDRISQESSEYEKMYLVATNMNCIRKVSIEDIEFIS